MWLGATVQGSVVVDDEHRARGVLENTARGGALQAGAKPCQPSRADDDGRDAPLTGQLDDRVRCANLAGHGDRLGVKPGRPRELGPLLGDTTGVSLELLPKFLRLSDVERGRLQVHTCGRAVCECLLPYRRNQNRGRVEERSRLTDSPTAASEPS